MENEKKLETIVESISIPQDPTGNCPKEMPISQLKNEKRMYRRLSQEWDKHSSTIIYELQYLDGRITNDYKAFRSINASLHRELSKNIFSTENFKKNFQNFQIFITNHKAYADYPEVVNIFKAYAALRDVRNEYKTNKVILNALYEDKSAKQSANAAKEEERRGFRKWLRKTNHVSIQRIIELYPEEIDQQAMLKQCAALGVVVFDSRDREESKAACQEYYQHKAILYNF